MLILAIRFGVLTLGLGFAWLALVSWRSGDPPSWTVFKPSESAVVIDSTVETGLISNGTHRSLPVVTVEWPQGSGAAVALEGLTPSFYAYRRAEADEIIARYRPGEPTSVRPHEGRLFANRIDLFGILHAGFLSLFALFLLAVGTMLAIGGRRLR